MASEVVSAIGSAEEAELGKGGGIGVRRGETGRVTEVFSGMDGRVLRCTGGGAEEAVRRAEVLALKVGGRLGLRLRELTDVRMRVVEAGVGATSGMVGTGEGAVGTGIG